MFDLDFLSWQGTGTVRRHAQRRCEARFWRDDPITEASAEARWPTKGAWMEDDHEVVCIAEYPDKKPGRRHP